MTAQPAAGHYRFRHVARMEWIKLRTLRSVRWTLLFALAGMTGIGIAAGYNTRNPRGDVTNNILVGGALGQVLFAVLPARGRRRAATARQCLCPAIPLFTEPAIVPLRHRVTSYPPCDYP